MAKAKIPVAVDGIEFDALLEQTNDYAADIPDYPVEDGFNVQDTIILQPHILSLTLFLSNTPVTWKTRFESQGENRVDSVLEKLHASYEKRQLVTVVTTDKTYNNMGIESYSVKKSTEIGYAREITMRLKEVKKTATEKTSIPDSYGKSGTTGAMAGDANLMYTEGAKRHQTNYNSASPGGSTIHGSSSGVLHGSGGGSFGGSATSSNTASATSSNELEGPGGILWSTLYK